jgi:hypothetical protein
MSTSLNLVVVEDSDDLRMLLKNALRTEGHHVVALSCAEELEDHSAIDQIDAFLIDINLPGEDGFSLAKRIRHVHTLAGIIRGFLHHWQLPHGGCGYFRLAFELVSWLASAKLALVCDPSCNLDACIYRVN